MVQKPDYGRRDLYCNAVLSILTSKYDQSNAHFLSSLVLSIMSPHSVFASFLYHIYRRWRVPTWNRQVPPPFPVYQPPRDIWMYLPARWICRKVLWRWVDFQSLAWANFFFFFNFIWANLRLTWVRDVVRTRASNLGCMFSWFRKEQLHRLKSQPIFCKAS